MYIRALDEWNFITDDDTQMKENLNYPDRFNQKTRILQAIIF